MLLWNGAWLSAKERPLAKSNESDRESAARVTADRSLPELARALRSQANQIVEAWTGAVSAAVPAPTDLPSPELQKHLPAILAKMADAIEPAVRQNADEQRQHSPAQEPTPFQQRYDVRALMTEDRLLRRVIIERVKAALGRQLIKSERVTIDKGIDSMLQEAVTAQNGWAGRPAGSSKKRGAVIPSSTPVAPTRNISSTFDPFIGTGAQVTSLEKPAATSTSAQPAPLTRKPAVPVFVELPPKPQEHVLAAQVASSRPTEAIRAGQNRWAEPARNPAIAPRKPAERVAVASRKPDERVAVAARVEALENRSNFPGAAAARQAAASSASENAALRAASLIPANSPEITHEWISVAAYFLWENHGRQEGGALRDWFQAEGELRRKPSASQQSK